ncbi:Pr6Pr family membrane protein [Microbacterium sp. JZ31]|uniref:Pr6Pr family membrane protein n=1 Tax=Microbacterium sp. JZ31 TaxID=1906274 RepID=UPI001933216B|nr:Pr6Pr family membrane protein [Microbacterium sp. JZ31]
MRRLLAAPQFWFRGLLILCSVYGFMVGSHSVSYLTTITNAILLGYLVVGMWTMWVRRSPDLPAPRLRGAIVTWMLFICVIAHVMLENWANPFDRVFDPDPAQALSGIALLIAHYVMPVGMLIDWLAFGPRGRTTWRDLVWWPVFPLAYGLLTIVRAIAFPSVANRIPYPFMQPRGDDWFGVLVSLLPMIVAVAAIGAVVIGWDRAMARLAGVTVPAARAALPVADRLSP